MPDIEKIVDKMRRQSNGIRYAEAHRVLTHYGYAFARQNGSHMQYRNASGDVVTIKYKRDTIKSCYVNDILWRIGGLTMTVREYMLLPYTYVIEPVSDESGDYFVGKVLELDGCMTDGDTAAETFRNLLEAMEGYIETKLEGGFPVPINHLAKPYIHKLTAS